MNILAKKALNATFAQTLKSKKKAKKCQNSKVPCEIPFLKINTFVYFILSSYDKNNLHKKVQNCVHITRLNILPNIHCKTDHTFFSQHLKIPLIIKTHYAF